MKKFIALAILLLIGAPIAWAVCTAPVSTSGGGSGTLTSISTDNGIQGGPITATGTISGVNAAADGATKGVAAFNADDFNSSAGVISIDYSTATVSELSGVNWTYYADLNLVDDTAHDFSTAIHGLVPKGVGLGKYLKDDGTWGVPSGSGSPTDATYITQTSNASLSAEQALSGLTTGIVKVTNGTGVLSTAVAGDFPTLNQNTSGTAANVSGTPALPNGTTATTQSQADASTKLATTAYVDTGLGTKQETLVSTTNIKSINGFTILGSGDLTVTSSGGIPLLVNGGTYALTNAGIEAALAVNKSIIIDGAVSLTGDIDIAASNTYIKCTPATVITLANATNTAMVSLNGYDGVTIDGCTFDANAANQTSGSRTIDVDSNVTDFVFKHNYIHDTYGSAIYSNGLVRGRFLYNRFKDVGKSGTDPHSTGMALHIYGTSNDVLIQGNIFDAGRGDGQIFVYGTDTSNRAKNVKMLNNEGFGIVTGDEKCCIQNKWSDNASIIGNGCHDNANDGTAPDYGNNGICSFDSDNVTVTGNTVKTVDGTGIEVYGAKNATVTTNTVETCGTEQGYAGIYIDTDGFSVANNTIRDCKVGIQNSGGAVGTVIGNTIYSTSGFTVDTGLKIRAEYGDIHDTIWSNNVLYAEASGGITTGIIGQEAGGNALTVSYVINNRLNGNVTTPIYRDTGISGTDLNNVLPAL